KPHDGRGTHACIERTMIEHVVNSGWLEGKLKRAGGRRSRDPSSRSDDREAGRRRRADQAMGEQAATCRERAEETAATAQAPGTTGRMTTQPLPATMPARPGDRFHRGSR